jgi:hypothetical protein
MMLTKISAKAPTPMMNAKIAPIFEELRKDVKEQSGVDFLSKCGDVFRPEGFATKKTGVAFYSNHKTGRAFDYDQTSNAIVLVNEPSGGKMYWRTYLKCVPQDGSKGVKKTLKDKRGSTYTGYVVDFTALAHKYGFERIPARSSWKHDYNSQEFWHYQRMEGLTWEEAMKEIRTSNRTTVPKNSEPLLLVKGDSGKDVSDVQSALAKKGFLNSSDVDGKFGSKTYAAIRAFQRANKLDIDGKVGPQTRAKLFN